MKEIKELKKDKDSTAWQTLSLALHFFFDIFTGEDRDQQLNPDFFEPSNRTGKKANTVFIRISAQPLISAQPSSCQISAHPLLLPLKLK